jgi:hypothetical protein
MTDTTRRVRAILFAAMAVLATPCPAAAGAWTQAEGQWQVINTVGYSQADKGFDAQSRADAPIKFDKFYLNGLAEYGVSDTITLFVAPEYVVADSSWSGATPTRASNFAIEGGARVRLSDAFGIVSLQGSFKSAGPFDLSNSVGHDSARIAELRLLDGFSFKLFGDDGFADIEAAERWISHPRPNETAFDATAGLWLSTDTLLMAQSFNTISGGDALPPYSYYRTHKLEVSVVENLSARWSVQLGLFASPAGQNSLVEQGVTASLWTRF